MPKAKSVKKSRQQLSWSRKLGGVFILLFAATGVTLLLASYADTPVKKPIQGLIDRQKEPPKTVLGPIDNYVIKVNWKDLQPVQGGPLNTKTIDDAIVRVRQPDYKAKNVQLKLRVFAGIQAPEWAKNIGGAPFYMTNGQEESITDGGTIGRFWLPAYGKAYAELQRKLAAKYDEIPEIHELTISRCTTLFDEPYIRGAGAGNNRQNLLSAGYTRAQDDKCHQDEIKAHRVWKKTISDLDFNPFPIVEDKGGAQDEAYTERMMEYCRQILGKRCGLQNNSLSSDKIANKTYRQMYAKMKSLGAPIVIQTATYKRIGDWRQVLEYATNLGVNSVELPAGYEDKPPHGYEPKELAIFSQRLKASAVPK